MDVVPLLLLLVISANGAWSRQFLHISDIHLDVNYKVHGEKTSFCREETPGGSGGASKFGSYKCDSPRILVESAFKAMKNLVPDPEFILWTGDNSAHDKTLNRSNIMTNLRFVTQRLHNVYPNVPVVPVLGNHDSSPADFFPDSNNKSTKASAYSDYITDGSFGDLLHSHTPEAEEFKKCGYYVLRNNSYDVNVTQTFIVLNTALYYHNKAIDAKEYPEDPCGQFAWLNKTLSECKKKERVFIVAHVPPGYFEHYAVMPMFSNEHYTKTFMDIITNKDNAAKIVAHFYGHTHTDSFRLFMNKDHEPVGLAFIAPSITPLVFVRDGVNPSFRAYEYDHQNRTIVTYQQFYLPLNQFIGEDEDEDGLDYDNEDYDNEEEEENLKRVSDRRAYNSKMLNKRQATTNDTQEDLEESDLVTDLPEDENETTTVQETTENITTEIAKDDLGDSDLDILVNGWQFGFNARLDYDIEAMDIRSMYKVYSDMRHNRDGKKFKYFLRHSFVLQGISDGLDCNQTCQAHIICTLADITVEDFQDCLVSEGVLQDDKSETLPSLPTPIQMTTSTTTQITFSTTTTRKNWLAYKTTTTTSTPRPEIGIENEAKDEEDDSSANVVKGVIIGLALVALVTLGVVGLVMYQRMRRRRYCSQEFLLDSFRYDGYSQLDQPMA